jgi:hypothetical protein
MYNDGIHFHIYMSRDFLLFLPSKMVNQNQYHIFGLQKYVTVKILKDAGMGLGK